MLEGRLKKAALLAQRAEITECLVYERLATKVGGENGKTLARIAECERRHYEFWKQRTGADVAPSRPRAAWIGFLARTLGLTFALKLMEHGEGRAEKAYAALAASVPGAEGLGAEEDEHERQILAMLDEERLNYMGSIVLGLNDALVELTGALAGFTLALRDTKLISLAGLVTGISAAFSMAASDYLSSRAEGDPRAKKSALYTGMAYLLTVAALIAPYLLIEAAAAALAVTLATAVLIIAGFNYYLATAKDLDFKRRFLEMAAISLGVAAFSFLLGYLLKELLGVDA
jgi:VIT1/CCC1 family predicted Fe2+/Mn2+ transporter